MKKNSKFEIETIVAMDTLSDDMMSLIIGGKDVVPACPTLGNLCNGNGNCGDKCGTDCGTYNVFCCLGGPCFGNCGDKCDSDCSTYGVVSV